MWNKLHFIGGGSPIPSVLLSGSVSLSQRIDEYALSRYKTETRIVSLMELGPNANLIGCAGVTFTLKGTLREHHLTTGFRHKAETVTVSAQICGM